MEIYLVISGTFYILSKFWRRRKYQDRQGFISMVGRLIEIIHISARLFTGLPDNWWRHGRR